MTKSYDRGHEIVYVDGRWFYLDNMSKFDESRICKRCNKPHVNGHDACINNLKGVREACCGHGVYDSYSISEAQP